MVLVDIYVPVIDVDYDFVLDENVIVDTIIFEISEMIAKKMKCKNIGLIDEFFLYSVDKKCRLEKGKTLFQCGIGDGCRLLLV